MNKQKRLPGRNISAQEIIDALTEILLDNQQPTEIKKQANETKDRILLTFAWDKLDNPILLTLIKRSDGTVSISVADNPYQSDARATAQSIRDALYDKLDFGKSKEPFLKRYISKADFDAIELLFDSVGSLDLKSKKEDSNERFAQYVDSEDSKLTIHFYKRRHIFLVQFGTKQLERIAMDVIREATGYYSIEEYRERKKQGESIETILKPSMINSLGEDLYCFFQKENPPAFDTLITAYQDMSEKRQTITRDYSSVIQSICRCYEALMKTLFKLLGLPKEKYVLDYMDWNKKEQIHRLKLGYLSMGIDLRYRLGFLYDQAYGKYRNDVSHGGPPDAHFEITDYTTAESWFENVAYSMKASHALLSKYL